MSTFFFTCNFELSTFARISAQPLVEMEIVTLFPLDGSFIRLAGRMVDPALGVAVGWNHFVSLLTNAPRTKVKCLTVCANLLRHL